MNRELDWAVLTLETPVPSHISPMSIQPVGKSELTDLGLTILVGYHFDLPATTQKAVSNHCSPEGRYRSSTLIAHFCDTYGGSSGALIYKIVEGVPVAVALHTGFAKGANHNRALLFGCRLQAGLRAEGVETGKNQACVVGSRGGDNWDNWDDGDTLIVVDDMDDAEKFVEKIREACAKPDVSVVTVKSKDGGILTARCVKGF